MYWKVTTPATCTTAGEETRTCKLDATHTEARAIPIDTNAHDWGDWVETTPSTTTTEGVETKTCKHDASHKETQPIDRLPDTLPHDQTATITLSFKKQDATEDDPFLTATVKGTLTNAEWDGVADKIETAINDGFGALSTDRAKNMFIGVFSRDVTIIVEAETDGYTRYKIIGDGKTIYLSLDATNGANLPSLLTAIISGLNANATGNM
ncbi:MAG: hypothetical protein LBC52_00625 [Treponema sp.]|jgi:hypothetical protein|nr:hypothetical protein [Treponema sp.]